MLDATGLTPTALEAHLASSGDPLVPLAFAGSAPRRGFGEQDACLVHAIAHLPDRGRLPVAIVSGVLAGADLALALACPLIVMDRDAQLVTGFGQPGSAAVYVLAARHIGAAACERLLFGGSALLAESAAEARLVTIVDGVAEALPIAANRLSTMIAVARANLVTWPLDPAKARALIDAS